MKISLSKSELCDYTSAQLNHLFPDPFSINLKNDFSKEVDLAIFRLENCFKEISLKHYNDGEQTHLNHLFTDQYLMYVWFLANTIFKENPNKNICNKLYGLNKSLFAFDCMYDTELPNIFIIFHGAGTMLGKAKYSDYFIALQGCTIGSHKGKYPILDKAVSLTAHSSIIGDCSIGKRVSIGSYSNVFKKNIENDHVAIRNENGELSVKSSPNNYAQQFFIKDLKSL